MSAMQQTAVTARQIRAIKMAQRDLGIDDDAYRERLAGMFGGRTSCKQLSAVEASMLIRSFERDGWRLAARKKSNPGGRRIPKGVTPLPTSGQLKKLGAMADLVTWRAKDGYRLWVKKRFGFERPRTSGDARKVIDALRAMFERQMKSAHGPHWKRMRHDDPRVQAYIIYHPDI